MESDSRRADNAVLNGNHFLFFHDRIDWNYRPVTNAGTEGPRSTDVFPFLSARPRAMEPDPMCEEWRFDADAVDAGRERIYEFLASVLSHPDSGMGGRATDPKAQREDVATVDSLRRAAAAWNSASTRARSSGWMRRLNGSHAGAWAPRARP